MNKFLLIASISWFHFGGYQEISYEKLYHTMQAKPEVKALVVVGESDDVQSDMDRIATKRGVRFFTVTPSDSLPKGVYQMRFRNGVFYYRVEARPVCLDGT